MEVNNPRYKNQGIHVVSAIFTVDKGITKVLIIRRKNEPFKDSWSLVSGALYNDEEIMSGMQREIKEKTGIENIHLELFDVFGDVERSPLRRMVAIAYLGIIDKEKYNILKETFKTSDADWIPINLIPELDYDHNTILNKLIEKLKARITESDLLSHLYPEYMWELTIHERFLNGESLMDLYDRVKILLEEISDWDEILIVTHRGVINMIYFIMQNRLPDYDKKIIF